MSRLQGRVAVITGVASGIGLAWWEFGRKRSPRRGFIYSGLFAHALTELLSQPVKDG